MTPLHVHDLVRLDVDAVTLGAAAPGWVAAHLAGAPWAVVRRPGLTGDGVAVGVRGSTRAERYALHVPVGAVTDRVRPEDLRADLLHLAAGSGPLADTVRALHPWLTAVDAQGLGWGPVGAVGFQLATGRRVVTATSDLDLVVRLDGSRTSSAASGARSAALAGPPPTALPVDVLLETPGGAMVRAEAASGASEVLLRTPEGPRLVPNPWLPTR